MQKNDHFSKITLKVGSENKFEFFTPNFFSLRMNKVQSD